MTAIRNMTCQHKEFESWLDDAERLRLYSQSPVCKHRALEASLAKAESKSQHWKQEVKANAEKIARAEKERDEAKQEAKVASKTVLIAGKTKARAEDDLTMVREFLGAEVAHLMVERTSLLPELEASRDEVSALHS